MALTTFITHRGNPTLRMTPIGAAHSSSMNILVPLAILLRTSLQRSLNLDLVSHTLLFNDDSSLKLYSSQTQILTWGQGPDAGLAEISDKVGNNKLLSWCVWQTTVLLGLNLCSPMGHGSPQFLTKASILVVHRLCPAQFHGLYQCRATMTLAILYMNENVIGIHLALLTIRLAIYPLMDTRMPLWDHPLNHTSLQLYPKI